MNITTLIELGWKHAQNAVAEEIYLKSGFDMTKPVAFYGIVNERCNVACRYCEYWRLEHYQDEMTNAEWQKALLSIKDFVGTFSINFSGGEPFLRRDFTELLAWCNSNGINAGVTTNGSALTRKIVERVVSAKPFNVNISVDAPTAEVHDYLRGAPGLFDKLSNGIRYLVEERERQGINFPITIKPTINAKNFRYLPAMLKWTQEIGATCMSPQPMNRWTPETYNELWIEEAELPEFEQVIEQLVAMKHAGAPILTPEAILRLMPDHFREKQAPREVMPCRVGLRNMTIRTNGDVESCFVGFPILGSLKTQSAEELWYSPEGRAVRRDTVACEKLCLITCLSQKKLTDKVKMGLQLVRGGQAAAKARADAAGDI
jgi:MoaA/NifB/PqqE/SkfB family radical SAM enzyme